LTLKFLPTSRQDVFGLDIGGTVVKIVELHRDHSGYVATAAASAEIAHFEKGDTDQERQNIVAAIRKCVRSARIKTKYAICGLCGPDVAVRNFSFPPLPDNQIVHAVLVEAEQVCPFDVNQCVVDYQIIGEFAEESVLDETPAATVNPRVHGILVAATNEIVVKRRQLAKEASLNCVYMDINGLALLNCFLESEKLLPGQTIALLDIGARFTNLIIMRHDGLPFIRDIPYAGNDIINRMASERKVSTEVMRNFLSGTEETVLDLGDIKEELRSACNQLVVNIAQTLRYYMAQESVRVDRIYVCGGLAQIRGLTELLTSQLPSKIELWNPFTQIRCQAHMSGRKLLEKNGPAMAVAAGLAMRMI